MSAGDQLVPLDAPVYREFVRLYRIARSLRPAAVDRWNGELFATDSDIWGSVHPVTGAVRLSATLVLPYLTGLTSHRHPVEQAEALATVLHETTHLGMRLKALEAPNAVHSMHAYGLAEGVAEVRAVEDFQPFTWRAGYDQLVLGRPQYAGAYAATAKLLGQVSGPLDPPEQILDDLVAGPAAMHFDRLAAGVVRTRLWDVVPERPDHQRSVRAALIGSMLHGAWPLLPDYSAEIGERVAEEIRGDLNSKVEEIRGFYGRGGRGPVGDDGLVREARAGRVPLEGRGRSLPADALEGVRLLGAQAAAGGAAGWRPSLGQGVRQPSSGHGARRSEVRGSRPWAAE